MAELMDTGNSTSTENLPGNEDPSQELMDTSPPPSSLSSSENSQTFPLVVMTQPVSFQSQPSAQTPHGQNLLQNLCTAGDPRSPTAVSELPQDPNKSDEKAENPSPAAAAAAAAAAAKTSQSSETGSEKPASDHKARRDKLETLPSAPPDEALVHVKVDWPETLPDRWNIKLEIALQSWCNSLAKGSVKVVKLLDDERTAEVKISPASVLKDLKTATIKFKERGAYKSVEAHFQKAERKLEYRSSCVTDSENLTPGAASSTKDAESPSNLAGVADSPGTSAPLTVNPLMYCYLSQIYKKEVEEIEKKFKVKITAETCISFSAENAQAKSDGEPVQGATQAFTELYQNTMETCQMIPVPPTDMESDVMKEMLRNISNQENRIMLNISANQLLLFGPDIKLMVTHRLPLDAGSEAIPSTPWLPSSGYHTEPSRSYTGSMQRSQNLGVVVKDMPAWISMDEAHWKLLTNEFMERLIQIQRKYGVDFQAEPAQGSMKVTACSRVTSQVHLEAHALSALTQLYQKVTASALTCDLTHTSYAETKTAEINSSLSRHANVQGGRTNGKYRLFGLPKHLAPAIADIEKNLGREVFDVAVKKMLENLWNLPQAGEFRSRQTDTAGGVHATHPKLSNKPADKESEDECPICLEAFTDKTKLKCGHEFCRGCLNRSIESVGQICPLCKSIFGVLMGNQPEGTMQTGSRHMSLPGYLHCGVIEIRYIIPSGIQTSAHPNPGRDYHGTERTAYLPDNAEGRQVLALLKRAFDQKLIFTVGRSSTTGADNTVIWNDIHHKTNTHGGPPSYGYPDPDYLNRVKKELKAKGIE